MRSFSDWQRLAARVSSAALLLGACASPPAEPPKPEAAGWLPMETGSSCTKAEVSCGPGNCAARIDNCCDQPRTCKLTVQCICQAFTGESGEARSHASDKALAHGKLGLRAFAICSDGEVVATLAESVDCR
ncbi:MAG: hypothetical protein FJ096_18525 [Deltaproteobacteria bacterium]|nr:hypothetical protein [Deltaproteobacteria bacterium]